MRPIARQDAELELEFLKHLSPEFRNARFLDLIHAPSPEVAGKLTDIDPANAVAFITRVPHEGRDHQVDTAQARGIRHMRACAPVRSGGSDHRASGIGFRRRVDPDDPATIIYDLQSY
jgi:acetyltransferase